MTSKTLVRGAAALLTLLAAGSASAHLGHDGGHGAASLIDGLAHPLGADHLLAMVAVGAWSAAGAGTARRWLGPLCFLLAMSFGALLGLAGVQARFVEPSLALSVLMLGAMLAFATRLPTGAGLVLVSLTALLHGLAHGAELPAGASVAAYAAGFLLTTAMLHAGGVGLGLALRQRSARLWQGLGATLGAAGLTLLLRA